MTETRALELITRIFLAWHTGQLGPGNTISKEKPKHLIVAIDGPAGAGKSTIARAVAGRLNCVYIDTGAMYRAVALWALRAGIPVDDHLSLEHLAREARIEFEPGGNAVMLNGEDVTLAIREPEVTEAASKVSTIGGVRRALQKEQRRIGQAQAVVMEGRDIGTIVFPDATVKVFLDAAPEVRAGRRARETGSQVEQTARELSERDTRDRTRAEAPLTQAPDAEYMDTTHLPAEQVEEAILKLIRKRTANGKSQHHS